nr:hypothetical protein B0A51_07391 [Rachicladosporium sp. CCFEE 5018]
MHSPAISSAADSSTFEIPLIDFSEFLNGSPETRRTTALAILTGFQRSGFIYLKNFGLPKPLVAETFAKSAAFFKRPLDQKNSLAWTTPAANRGYVAEGLEKVTDRTEGQSIEELRQQEGQDLKESFEIGREGEEGHPNHWPDHLDADGGKFKAHMQEFFGKCTQLHVEVMRAIAVGLGLEERWFDGYCDQGDNTLRLLHYPEVSTEVFRKNGLQVRAGAHTDYGKSRSITLLFQDMAGGLQVESPNGTFVDATPIEDTVVVNAGDLLARWSNDNVKSTKHRVVEPRKAALSEKHPPRYSIAFFCNPNFDRFIEAIPGTYDEVNVRKYEGVNRNLLPRSATTTVLGG